jgi:putative ABC transport system permease protein
VSLLRRLVAQVPTLVLARRNVARAKTRSVLAVLAIVIGVVAIGGIGVGGEAFKQDQLSAYERFSGTMTVDPVRYEDRPASRVLDEQQIQEIRQAADNAEVFPSQLSRGGVIGPDGETINFFTGGGVRGIEDPSAFYETQAGEIPADFQSEVAVVGASFAESNDISTGDMIEIPATGGGRFRVVGVLNEQGDDPLSADSSVFVPLSAFDRDEYDQAIVKASIQFTDAETVAESIRTSMNDRDQVVDVTTASNTRDRREQQFQIINQFLIGISAISLLVAAVTIANTMLMSAIEREGEIGVLRAVGYSKFAVVRLLVAESTLLGVVGVGIGGPVALGAGVVANQVLIGDPLAFTTTGLAYIGIGIVFGVVTALVGGLYPAWRAANKRPVEALG